MEQPLLHGRKRGKKNKYSAVLYLLVGNVSLPSGRRKKRGRPVIDEIGSCWRRRRAALEKKEEKEEKEEGTKWESKQLESGFHSGSSIFCSTSRGYFLWSHFLPPLIVSLQDEEDDDDDSGLFFLSPRRPLRLILLWSVAAAAAAPFVCPTDNNERRLLLSRLLPTEEEKKK